VAFKASRPQHCLQQRVVHHHLRQLLPLQLLLLLLLLALA
jgi:hypothetical protein